MNLTHLSSSAFQRPRRRQQGVVMFIALIVMVALSLAAIALVRSVDTTNAIVGNLSFRMASILPANLGVEKAAAALFQDADIANTIRIPDRNADYAAENYFASRQVGEDPRGIPFKLQKKVNYPFAVLSANDSAAGATEIRYVIERMCTQPGAPTFGTCDLLSKNIVAGTGGELQKDYGIDVTPFYRVTIRVDGPQNTASFLQATLK